MQLTAPPEVRTGMGIHRPAGDPGQHVQPAVIGQHHQHDGPLDVDDIEQAEPNQPQVSQQPEPPSHRNREPRLRPVPQVPEPTCQLCPGTAQICCTVSSSIDMRRPGALVPWTSPDKSETALEGPFRSSGGQD